MEDDRVPPAAPAKESSSSSACKDVPNLLSSFVDTFVDFSVSGGLFLLPQNDQNALPHHRKPGDDLQTYYPPQDRLIAIGDLHGDLEKTKESLRLAKLIDPESGKWVGGSSTLVQIGDVFDRGGDELKILYYLEKLRREAARCGGTVITMHGNHEIMNVEGDFRFATDKGLDEFRGWADWYCIGNRMKSLCKGLEKPKDPFDGVPLGFKNDNEEFVDGFRGWADWYYCIGNRIKSLCKGLKKPKDPFDGVPLGLKNVKAEFVDGFRARIAALRPNGPISSRFLSKNLTVLVVGDSVFVHGGLLAAHVSYGLEKINAEVRDWIHGLKGKFAPDYCHGRNAVVWLRKFSHEFAEKCDCSALEHVLSTIPGAKRMIMGHTIQEFGINGVCEERAIRIDVGMSKGCINGLPEVLEITGNSGMRILTSKPLYEKKKFRSSVESERRPGPGFLPQEHGPKQVEVKA